MATSRDPSSLLADIIQRTMGEQKSINTDNESRLAALISGINQGPGASYALPNLPSPLLAGITALLSNTASAVSGNRGYSESNTRQFENTINNRRQAESTKAGLDYQQALERHSQLLQVQSQDLQRRYDAARALGEHAHAVELQKAILDNSNQQAKLQRDLQKYLGDQAKRTAIQVAEINNRPQPKIITGDPNLDRMLRVAEGRRVVQSMEAEAYKDATGGKIPFAKWKAQNPQWGQMDSMLASTLSQEKPYPNEPSQQYVSRLGFAGLDNTRIAALAKANFPNEQLLGATPPAAAAPTSPVPPSSTFGTPLGTILGANQPFTGLGTPTPLGLGGLAYGTMGLPLQFLQYLTTPYNNPTFTGPPSP